jgi:hypothetical protein
MDDTRSEEFAQALFSAFPDWRALAREMTYDGGDSSLLIDVPAPPEAEAQRGLRIDIAGEQLTIGFDWYHCHFEPDEWFMDPCLADEALSGAAAALEFVKRIVSEQLVVVSYWRDTAWRGSSHRPAGSPPVTEFLAADLRSLGSDTSFNHIRVRSWKGTFNTEIAT